MLNRFDEHVTPQNGAILDSLLAETNEQII